MKNISPAKYFGLLALALLSLAQPVRAQDRAMVAPFENRSANSEYNWIGESFAIMLSDLLATPGLEVVTPEERWLVYQRLKIPQAAIVSRAASIRVAEFAGAGLLLVGSYEVTGPAGEERIRVLCRPIDLHEGKMLGAELNAGGPLKDLSELQGALTWEILFSRDRNLPYSKQRVTSQAAAFTTKALEYYTKGMMTENLQARTKLLRLTIRQFGKTPSGPAYTRTAFDLGRALYDSGEYAEAIPLFREVGVGSAQFDEARFYLGVALYQTNDLDGAIAILQALEKSLRLPEVTNNLAVAEIKKNRIAEALPRFSQAVAHAAEDPDIRFNYGYALWLSGDYPNAITQLRQVLRRRATDGEAQYLLAKALERGGEVQEARGALIQARRYLSSFAQWESGAKMPVLARIKPSLNRTSYYAGVRNRTIEELEQRRRERSQRVMALLASARQSFELDREEEALATLEKLVQIAPDSGEAHYFMARIYDKRGDYRSAANELRAATFWEPQHTAAHLLLARVYLALHDTAQARESLQRVLRRDPQNPDALKLQAILSESAATHR